MLERKLQESHWLAFLQVAQLLMQELHLRNYPEEQVVQTRPSVQEEQPLTQDEQDMPMFRK